MYTIIFKLFIRIFLLSCLFLGACQPQKQNHNALNNSHHSKDNKPHHEENHKPNDGEDNFQKTQKEKQSKNEGAIHPSGAVLFKTVPRLPENWWEDETGKKMWEGWDKKTIYLWGANSHNYNIFDPKKSLKGGGMASKFGPTRGHGHPNYVGVNTMSNNYTINEEVFNFLHDRLLKGYKIVIPTFKKKFSLGTGIAINSMKNEQWKEIQRMLFIELNALINEASEVDFGDQSFWPDCTQIKNCNKASDPNAKGSYPLNSKNDLRIIIDTLKE